MSLVFSDNYIVTPLSIDKRVSSSSRYSANGNVG